MSGKLTFPSGSLCGGATIQTPRLQMLVGYIEKIVAGRLHGWAAQKNSDGSFSTIKIHIEVNGQTSKSFTPNNYRADLYQAGIGDGAFSFDIALPKGASSSDNIEVRSDAGDQLKWVKAISTENSKSFFAPLRHAFRAVMAIAKKVVRFVARIYFGEIDAIRQKLRLKNYEKDIILDEKFRQFEGGVIAALVYYEPDGNVSLSVLTLLNSLRDHGTGIVIITNTRLSALQKEIFSEYAIRVVTRGNTGFDFGCYKDFFNVVLPDYSEVTRVIILNDSVYYIEKGMSDFVLGLLGPEDVIAPFENWGEGHHIQSFCVSCASSVVENNNFKKFWREYIPVNNRLYAIENGEKLLTSALLASARSTKILYPVADLALELRQDFAAGVDKSLRSETIPEPWRGYVISGGHDNLTPIERLEGVIGRTSPIHAGAFFFPYYLDVPMIKKDIVYRGRFSFWEVELWSGEIMSDAERNEFLNGVRKKRDFSALSPKDKLKFQIGVK